MGKAGKEVLVVDDSQVVVSMLSDMLETLGFKVSGSLSGQDGLLKDRKSVV